MILETAILHALLAGPAIDLKCPSTVPFPGVEGPNPVMVVEGRVVLGDIEDLNEALNSYDVLSIEQTCWNPSTGELPARVGVAVVVVTTGRAVEEAQSDLRFLINAVRQFQTVESRLPESLAEIGITGLAASRFEFSVSDQGTTLSTAGPRDYHCSVSGDITNDVEMHCESSPGLAKVTLREAYDRGAQAL